ncbi:carboxypeptidase N subunit 2 [Trichomycterus rosablanca]|uniref:carboxypeptidase N subunit 2 n=1 Tax=Trichomycterus rosablanca TaxID=2290929 RepID=UPI002F353796
MNRVHVVALFLLLQVNFLVTTCCPLPCNCFSGTTMICSDSKMSFLPRDIPSRVKTLIVLASHMKTITFQENLGLTKAVFINNPVQHILSDAFDGLDNLEELEITGSPFTALDVATFNKMSNLTKLLLNNNQLEFLAGTFNFLQKLETLQLRGNNLTHLDMTMFHNLYNLHKLDLSLNELSTINTNLFSNLSRLKMLDLGLNQITSLNVDTFNCNLQLQILSLQGNQLTQLPSNIFTQLNKLEELNLRDNKILELSDGLFPSTLKKLNLRGNRLVQLPTTLFHGLHNLTHLDLSQNQLSTFQAEQFQNISSLEHLDLSVNKLAELPGSVFRGLLQIKTIYLQQNNLTSLKADLFKDLETMSRLYLSKNRLKNLPRGLFDSLDFQCLVRLHGNPWRCDCDLRYLQEWLHFSKDTVEDLSQVHCDSPQTLNGHSLTTLTNEQLVCVNSSKLQNFRTNTTSTRNKCSIEEVDDNVVIKCKLIECFDWKFEMNYNYKHGKQFQHSMKITSPKHPQCLNITLKIN